MKKIVQRFFTIFFSVVVMFNIGPFQALQTSGASDSGLMTEFLLPYKNIVDIGETYEVEWIIIIRREFTTYTTNGSKNGVNTRFLDIKNLYPN